MTIEGLIEELGATQRGQVFLINLYRTIQRGFVTPLNVKLACAEFLTRLSAGGHALPAAIDMADHLGRLFVAKGLWREGPEPILERQLLKRDFALSRVTSYGGFFYSILKRRAGMPPLSGLPEPHDISHGTEEIDVADVNKVRSVINSGRWKSYMVDDIRLDAECIWLAPRPKLRAKTALAGNMKLADAHRDIIGLSHLSSGRHLIRIDLDLQMWVEWRTMLRRRPHGAGNGGSRFRLQYDGRESSCQWGRTVDLARVAAGDTKSLNGIPELLIEGFSIPKTAVTATYLGRLVHPPEANDSFFVNRLRRNISLSQIKADLKRVLV